MVHNGDLGHFSVLFSLEGVLIGHHPAIFFGQRHQGVGGETRSGASGKLQLQSGGLEECL